MLRRCLFLLGLMATLVSTSGGCRSCSNCHDYGPPVANHNCQACGVHRAGSACGGCGETGCVSDGYYPVEGEIMEQPMPQYEPMQAQPSQAN